MSDMRLSCRDMTKRPSHSAKPHVLLLNERASLLSHDRLKHIGHQELGRDRFLCLRTNEGVVQCR